MKPAPLALAVFVLLPLVGGIASGQAVPKPRPAPRALNLFSWPFSAKALTHNRVLCGVSNVGDLCSDVTGSPVIGGGFWPRGTPDQYIFKSGLQVAGIIPATAGGGKPGFAWAGDTVGAYFTDGRGTQVHGDPLTAVLDSRDSLDLASWSLSATVHDTSIFGSTYLGRSAVSEQDLWARYWDGNPGFLNGRTHPAGVVVDQRAVAWTYPEGNQDIVYFAFTLYNVTARAPFAYANPTIPPALRSEIAALGARFQDSSEAQLGVAIPDGGYAIESLYVQAYMDADVGDAGSNYGTAVLPMGTAIAYKSDFSEPNWTFPPEIYGRRPFAAAPGLVGATFAGRDVAVFTTYSGTPAGHPDPVGVIQLWRYLSGNPGPGESPCTRDPKVDHVCFLDQSANDERVSISISLSTLPPGEAKAFVLAYVFAAPLDTVNAYVGGDLKPGIPFTGDSIAADTTRLRAIDRVAGWVTQNDANANGSIEADEVSTVPQSLLGKVQLAQTIVRNKFAMPAPPEPPAFFVIPGDNQVSVVWQPSGTEVVRPGGGDPYFPLAQDPLSPSYDPNYRQYDVEGYRIYRGTSPNRLELVAQLDYDGTSLVDYTGVWGYPGHCAPELGIQDDCPGTFPVDHPLAGAIVQVPLGGRIRTDNGLVAIIRADTAVTGHNSGFPPLTDTGVLFTFVDQGVRNSFRYFYAVTAFDVNSFHSGPSSLESPRFVKAITPRKPATNAAQPLIISGPRADDGTLLDPTRPYPTIDSATGTFNGPIPPANDGQLSLAALVPEALAAGDITVRIDSLGPGFAAGIGPEPNLYLTLIAGSDTLRRTLALPEPPFNSVSGRPYSLIERFVPYDSAAARRFGIAFTSDARMPVRYAGSVAPIFRASSAVAMTIGRYSLGAPTTRQATRYLAHSRWFDLSGSEPPDPTITACPDAAHNSGRLTGVGRIWAPQAYRDLTAANAAGPCPLAAINPNFRGYAFAQTAWYPADFLVTWNADSSLTVRDSTHRLNLPFKAGGGSGWGFLNLRALLGAGVTASTGDSATDVNDGTGSPSMTALGYHHLYATSPTCTPDWWGIPCVSLERTAQYQPLDFNADGTADANGIALLVNGEAFFMELGAIPAPGTPWRLRAVTGDVGASCAPAVGPAMTDCTAYTFTGPLVRPSYAPGLRYTITVQPAYTVDSLVSGDLARVHTVPDPLYVASGYELTPDTAALKFVNLPSRAIIRIYSVSGILVAAIVHNDPTGGGEATWNVRNRSGRRVASGVYFYHIEGPDGRTKVGRFTVIIGPGRGS